MTTVTINTVIDIHSRQPSQELRDKLEQAAREAAGKEGE